jgi:hypothetical protein
LKPTVEDKWYEFNDETVTHIEKSEAFLRGFGGPFSFFEMKDGIMIEKTQTNLASAYMLVYIRI